MEASLNDYQVQISLVSHSDNMETKKKKELLKMLKKGVEVIKRTNETLKEINKRYIDGE